MQKEYKHKYLKTNIKVNFLKKDLPKSGNNLTQSSPGHCCHIRTSFFGIFLQKVWLISKKFSHFEKMLLFFTVASYRGGNVRNLI